MRKSKWNDLCCLHIYAKTIVSNAKLNYLK